MSPLATASVYAENLRRVIVVDHREWILQILVEVVRQTLPDASVVTAENGVEGLAAFRAGGCDFLITNHVMPRLNGIELIRAVRRQSPDLPILMISVKPEAKAEALAAGANGFLLKERIMEGLPLLLLRCAERGTVAA